MVIIVEKGLRDSSSNLDKAVCILRCVNTIGKDIHPTILLPTMSK